MYFVYDIALAAGGVMTTNASAGTLETELTVRAGSSARTWLREIALYGRGAAATALNSILMNVRRYTTASTGGTAITPVPRGGVGMPAASATAASGAITGGSVNGGIVKHMGCGVTTQDAWYAPDAGSAALVGDAGSGDSVDFETTGSAASMPHAITCAIGE